jgi:NodT family efflux transporter outer membrane factor (OMF) lipoprotein
MSTTPSPLRAPRVPRALRSPRAVLVAAVTAAALAGCAVGPTYQRPDMGVPPAYKQAEGWVVAVPADGQERGPWWRRFGDPVLDALAEQIDVSNQNVAAAAAAYERARALVREQRSALFPQFGLDGGASRSGSRSEESSSVSATTGGRDRSSFQLAIGASWEPDVWGRLRRASEGAEAGAQASAADLGAARLASQGELAINYIGLRQSDAQKALLDDTLAGYQRSLQIARNRYAAGVIARTDVLQAETQLANAQADAIGLARSRAQFENAIAVLVGKAPAELSVAPVADWRPTVPEVPLGIPSTLLQRRPDIAAAERRVAAANQQIGIA